MGKTIFVRTRHRYVPYDDFFRLAELSGYPIIYVDEMLQHDSVDTTFVISPVNGEWNTRPRGYTQGRVILYMLEWNTDGEHNDPPCADSIWCGDKWHAEKHGYKYVPLGSHPLLNEYAEVETYKEYDAALMMYRAPPRRARIIHALYESGLKLAPDGWGIDRSRILLQSKCMAMIHQWDGLPVLPPLRMCIAAAHKLAVISETIENLGMFYGYMDCLPYEDLARMTKLIIRNPHNRLKERGEALYHLLCVGYTFKHAIERAL